MDDSELTPKQEARIKARMESELREEWGEERFNELKGFLDLEWEWAKQLGFVGSHLLDDLEDE